MDLSRCVFHARTPGNAGAERLEPLSALRTTSPEAYARAIAKYDDTPERRRLPSTRIPLLDVRWTEAVFLSPVRPHAIWAAWREIGGVELPAQEFWAIPIDEVRDAVVLDRRLTTTGDPLDDSEVSRLDLAAYRSAATTTPGSAAWIRELAGSGRRGAWFHRTPHVLTASPVPLGRAAVVDWREG